LLFNIAALFNTGQSADCVIVGPFVVAMYKDLVAQETGKMSQLSSITID